MGFRIWFSFGDKRNGIKLRGKLGTEAAEGLRLYEKT